jgi:hypothetical protein
VLKNPIYPRESRLWVLNSISVRQRIISWDKSSCSWRCSWWCVCIFIDL